MDEWIYDSLSHVLGEELSGDLTQYILSVRTEGDFEDYMKDLFDFSIREQRELYENIKAAKFGVKSRNIKPVSPEKPIQEFVPQPQTSSTTTTPDSAKKKTKKYRKYQLNELQKGYMKDGRNPCECQANRHRLINNCIECGRIVCEQEGSGPCFFCDNMVCTKEEMEILNSDTRESDALYRTLTDRKKSDTWKKALQNRNRLLDYDKLAGQHTKIIDDEHDYFDVNNKWLSKKERDKAAKKLDREQEQKHGSRLGSRKIVLDIMGKQAYEDTSITYEEDDDDDDAQNEEKSRLYKPFVPDITSLLESLKQDKANFATKSSKESSKNNNNALLTDNYVIQDKSYLEMNDKGMCLSMHQPWASLLVLGIKKHEGRTWYTPHRGTLWIAAASKPADPNTVQEVEEFYKKYYADPNIKFPEEYPTGCLLGSVLVQDCLEEEEYREQFPKGESESPYVLICSDPQKLSVQISMRGEHKIYKLNPAIHQSARDSLILTRRFTD